MVKTWIYHKLFDMAIAVLFDTLNINMWKPNVNVKVGDKYTAILTRHTYPDKSIVLHTYWNATVIQLHGDRYIEIEYISTNICYYKDATSPPTKKVTDTIKGTKRIQNMSIVSMLPDTYKDLK